MKDRIIKKEKSEIEIPCIVHWVVKSDGNYTAEVYPDPKVIKLLIKGGSIPFKIK